MSGNNSLEMAVSLYMDHGQPSPAALGLDPLPLPVAAAAGAAAAHAGAVVHADAAAHVAAGAEAAEAADAGAPLLPPTQWREAPGGQEAALQRRPHAMRRARLLPTCCHHAHADDALR